MEYGISLLDKASRICGSDYKLCKENGWPSSNVSNIRNGKRALPLEWVPVLAEIAGEDPREALARVMAERLPEGSRARAILGGVRAAGVVALLLLCVGWLTLLPSTGYARTMEKVNSVYIVECGRRVLALAIATVLRFLRADPFPPKPFGFLREPFAPPEASHLR